jgi:hypothetical protein
MPIASFSERVLGRVFRLAIMAAGYYIHPQNSQMHLERQEESSDRPQWTIWSSLFSRGQSIPRPHVAHVLSSALNEHRRRATASRLSQASRDSSIHSSSPGESIAISGQKTRSVFDH